MFSVSGARGRTCVTLVPHRGEINECRVGFVCESGLMHHEIFSIQLLGSGECWSVYVAIVFFLFFNARVHGDFLHGPLFTFFFG